MDRRKFLPTYHYEDSADGKIFNPAELRLRDYIIEGGASGTVGTKSPNLIPYPYYSTAHTENGITFTDNGDGSVTVNGTATANAYFALYVDLKNIDTTKKYVLSGSTNNVHVYVSLYQGKTWKREFMSRGQPIVIEFPTDIEFDSITVSSYVFNGRTAYNETIRPQLELGETATEYVPYGKYKIPIKISGKNMFDVNGELKLRYPNYQTLTVAGNSITVTNTVRGTGGWWCNIPVKAGSYVLSVGSTTGNIYINYLTEPLAEWNYSTISMGAHVLSPLTAKATSPIVANAEGYIVIAALVGAASDDNPTTQTVVTNIQVEQSDTAAAYEPYIEPRTQNIYIDNPIGIGERISMRTDDLPPITLNKGSNILTVETDIAPKSVKYQYYTY